MYKVSSKKQGTRPFVVTSVNKKHLKNAGPIRYCEPPLHCQSPGVASRMPAIAIEQAACDVHNNDNNAWQRGPLSYGPMEWAQKLLHWQIQRPVYLWTRNEWQNLSSSLPSITVLPPSKHKGHWNPPIPFVIPYCWLLLNFSFNHYSTTPTVTDRHMDEQTTTTYTALYSR